MESPRSVESGASVFVWMVWGLMLLALLAFVGVYGSNVPWGDDWFQLAEILGEKPVTLGWLWEVWNDHRLALPKLVTMTLLRLTGDYRAVMIFNALALGALAAAMIQTTRQLRGYSDFADAFFPFVLLHWGHYQDILWSFEIQFVLSTLLAGTAFLVVLTGPARLTFRAALLGGGCLLLLPLCGLNGLLYVPGLMVWFGLAAWRSRHESSRRRLILFLCVGALPLLLSGYYFVGYQRAFAVTAGVTVRDHLATMLQFLAYGFGQGAAESWPISGIVSAALFASAGALLVLALLFGTPRDRVRAVGLTLFFATFLLLAVAIGAGRSSFGPTAGFSARYSVLSVVGVCCLYLIWEIHGLPAGRSLARVLLFTLVLVGLASSTQEGYREARGHRERMLALESDLRAGEPLYRLIRRHAIHLVWMGYQDSVAEGMQRLHRTGVGAFVHLVPNPEFREVAMDLQQGVFHDLPWDPSTGDAVSDSELAHLECALSSPLLVRGCRITLENDVALMAHILPRLAWKRPDQAAFQILEGYHAPEKFADDTLTGRERFSGERFVSVPGEQTMSIWIDDTIDRIRFYPNALGPCKLRLTRITLLVDP